MLAPSNRHSLTRAAHSATSRAFVRSHRVSSPFKASTSRAFNEQIDASVSSSASQAQQASRNGLRVTAPDDDTGGLLEATVQATAGASVFTVSIKKPLGFVLSEAGGRIVVEGVTPGGHAAAAGVAAGDALLATCARNAQGPGIRGQLVLLPTAGERFATVTAAIRSNTCSQCSVHLVFERPLGPS